MMTSTVNAIMTVVAPIEKQNIQKNPEKVTVVGAGTVGAAIAFTLLAQKICKYIVLIDKDEALAKAETMDIMHATMYLGGPTIVASADYGEAKDSKICIITVGRRLHRHSQKSEAVKSNTDIFKEIIPAIATAAPNCIMLICSYPVDIMTYVAYKLSKFDPHRIFGSGTILESARFKVLIAQRLNVDPKSCQAFIIGEQGKRSVPVWSTVSVGGIRLSDVNPRLGISGDPEDWQDVFDEVVYSADDVNTLKSCGSWGIALSTGRIVSAILKDTKECLPLSTYIKGCKHGSDKDVFLSLPCIIGSQGIQSIVRLNLTEDEKQKIQKSADKLNEIQKCLAIDGIHLDGGIDAKFCAEGEVCSIPQH